MSSAHRRLHGIFKAPLPPNTVRVSATANTSESPSRGQYKESNLCMSKDPLPSNTTQTASATATATATESSYRHLYKERNLKRLVEKFKTFSKYSGFRAKFRIYENTVLRLAAAKHFHFIEDILEDQKKYKDISKEGFNARLIILYGKSGMFEHARKVFDEMPGTNCERTVLSVNALLTACVYAKEYDKVDGLFRQLSEELEIQPNVFTYTTVMKANCEMGSLDSGISLLDEMAMKGVEPNLITFNTLLHGLYTNGRFADGEMIWARMIEKKVIPDIKSYNAKLLGLALEKLMNVAVNLVEEMRNKGIKPDGIIFDSLIKGFVNDDNLEEAKKWYGEIKNNDYKPHKMTFATLIPFALQKGDFQFVFKLSKDIFSKKCLVDEALLQSVVDGFVKEWMIQEAKEIVRLGEKNRYCQYKLKLA